LKNLFKVLITFTILITSLNAFNFNNYLNNDNIIYLLVFVLLLFIVYLFRKKGANNNKCNNTTIQKNADENLYLNDIIQNIVNQYNEIVTSNTTTPRAKKGISNKLTEANIYLKIITDKLENKIENFDLEEFIKDINYTFDDKNSQKEFNIITNSNISYSVITDKNILKDIFTLLALLQFKEHNLKNATANIELDANEKVLKITVNHGLDYNKNIQKALSDNLIPTYNKDKKRYYGLYLYLINKLVNKTNGTLKIDILKKIYTLDIAIPINIEHLENKTNLLLPKELNSDKKALIICEDDNLSASIEGFLNIYNISSDVITDSKIVQMPNFLEYDILITNSNLLTSILSDYLISIKSYHSLKIVSIESKDKKHKYQKGLVDFKLEKPILQSKIYKMILHLFHDEIISTPTVNEANQSNNTNASALLNGGIKKSNKILVADDDRVNLHLLTKMIELNNVNVVAVSNGQEALDVLKEEKDFDLIILDSIMPKLDAYETIKQIRANEEFNHIPVIIHSSFSIQEHSIDTIFKLGFDSYLPKPFDMEKLQSILHRYLQITQPNTNIESSNSDIKKYYEEFIAIYGNSDKLLEKFVSQNQKAQIKSLLKDLKNISLKINNAQLVDSIDNLELKIKQNSKLDNNLIYTITNQIKESKNNILRKLNY